MSANLQNTHRRCKHEYFCLKAANIRKVQGEYFTLHSDLTDNYPKTILHMTDTCSGLMKYILIFRYSTTVHPSNKKS